MGSYGADGEININELKENLKQTDGVTGIESITKLPATVTVDDYEVTIDENGKVILDGGDNSEPPVSNVAVPGEKVTGDENKTYTKNGTATIPVGFAIVPGLDDVEEGLVISDVANDTENVGNQFVWIPVASNTPYERNTSYADTNLSTTAYNDTGYLPDGITNEEDAVRSAGGFYISRYEAGKEGTSTLVSKKGATVWVSIPQETAKTTAKTMFIDNAHVKSALISGIQWDMTMAFITRTPARKDGNGTNDYIVTTFNSSRHKGGSTPEEAGNNEADKVCNIYDLEGNAWEYVAEKNTYHTDSPFVLRGGTFGSSGSASSRNILGVSANSSRSSFRLALYVK